MNRFEKKADEILEKYGNSIISLEKEIRKLQNEQNKLYRKCRSDYNAEISKGEYPGLFWFTFSYDSRWGISSENGAQYLNLSPEEAIALLEYCEKYGPIPYTSGWLAPFDKWREENSKE